MEEGSEVRLIWVRISDGVCHGEKDPQGMGSKVGERVPAHTRVGP